MAEVAKLLPWLYPFTVVIRFRVGVWLLGIYKTVSKPSWPQERGMTNVPHRDETATWQLLAIFFKKQCESMLSFVFSAFAQSFSWKHEWYYLMPPAQGHTRWGTKRKDWAAATTHRTLPLGLARDRELDGYSAEAPIVLGFLLLIAEPHPN